MIGWDLTLLSLSRLTINSSLGKHTARSQGGIDSESIQNPIFCISKNKVDLLVTILIF